MLKRVALAFGLLHARPRLGDLALERTVLIGGGGKRTQLVGWDRPREVVGLHLGASIGRFMRGAVTRERRAAAHAQKKQRDKDPLRRGRQLCASAGARSTSVCPDISRGFSRPIRSSNVGATSSRRPCDSFSGRPAFTTIMGASNVVCAVCGSPVSGSRIISTLP